LPCGDSSPSRSLLAVRDAGLAVRRFITLPLSTLLYLASSSRSTFLCCCILGGPWISFRRGAAGGQTDNGQVSDTVRAGKPREVTLPCGLTLTELASALANEERRQRDVRWYFLDHARRHNPHARHGASSGACCGLIAHGTVSALPRRSVTLAAVERRTRATRCNLA
jgi:hypothetical protein